MARARPVILLTGFGPFPGRPENLTSRLVPELAAKVARRFRAHEVVAEVLPTEWERAPQRLAELYAEHAPKVALHFGVSDKAAGFTVETLATNRCLDTSDAAGRMPSAAHITRDGCAEIATRLPVEAIVARLRAKRLPVTCSADAGGYLCNTVFYRSLEHAAALPRAAIAGFVHVPVTLASATGEESTAHRPFDWQVALLGSLEIISICLKATR